MKLIQRQAAPDWSAATILLYGPPGVGKSTTAFGAPAPLVVDCEGGARAFVGDVAPIRAIAQLHQVIDFLAALDHPYESVVLDGLDALYGLTFDAGAARRSFKDRRLLHVEPGEELVAALRRLVDLPLLKVVTAHSRETEQRSQEKDKPAERNIHIALPGALRERVAGLVDVAAYCWRNGERRMIADATPGGPGRPAVWAKDRSGLFGERPRPLAWATIAQTLKLSAQ